jgi:hypothetical protein
MDQLRSPRQQNHKSPHSPHYSVDANNEEKLEEEKEIVLVKNNFKIDSVPFYPHLDSKALNSTECNAFMEVQYYSFTKHIDTATPI